MNSRNHPYNRRINQECSGTGANSAPRTPNSEASDLRPPSSLDLNTSNEDWLKNYTPEEEQPECQPSPRLLQPTLSSTIRKSSKPPQKQRYAGVTILSDGTYLPLNCFTELRDKFPGAFIRILNFLRIEDTPEVLRLIPANRRQIVVLFVGTRDTYGAINHHARRDNGPDRHLISLSQLSIKRGLDVLSRSSTTPAESTYLCTIPLLDNPTSTAERQHRNAASAFTTSIFNIINTGHYLQRQEPLPRHAEQKDQIIQRIKTELFEQRGL